MVGTNDVTHGVGPGDASRTSAAPSRRCAHAGALVVVGTCPDLGAVKPLLQPLRTVASFLSRRMAAAQAVAVVENDGIAVTLGTLLTQEFSEHAHLWSADRFHPSPEGYRRVADAILPSLLEGMGVADPGQRPGQQHDPGRARRRARRGPRARPDGREPARRAGRGRRRARAGWCGWSAGCPLVGRGAPDDASRGE